MVANETPFTSREKEAILTQFPSLGAPRDPESHKGTHGSIGVLGGGSGMTGAPILASMAALKLGAGRVFVGFNQDTLPIPYIASMPELMLYTAKDLIVEFRDSMNAWIVGPGLSQCAEARRILQQVLFHNNVPIVLDADALNLITRRQWVPREEGMTILTPHPKEAAQLLSSTTEIVQADREAAALQLAKIYRAIVVLKGPKTLIAYQDKIIWQNPSGNAGLATAGTGDVLAGIVGSLLAQGIPPLEAVPAAVWIHGKAADIIVAKGVGPIGLTASEIIPFARLIRNALTKPNEPHVV